MIESPDLTSDRPINARGMDALSDVLALLEPRTTFTASLTTGGRWAVHFPENPGVKFTALLRGSCWLALDDRADPVELAPGDCTLVSTAQGYRLASDLDLVPEDARAVFADAPEGRAVHGTGAETLLIGGRFTFDPSHTAILLGALPPLIHIRAHTPQAAFVPWILERLAFEASDPAPGSALMVDHLAHMLFVQVLRAHLGTGEAQPAGWLGALADRRIGLALNLMHRSPGRRWSLAQLTAATGMSRSAFASRFKQLVGTGPLDYLLHWRMHLAAKALRRSLETVAAIAFDLGYESESAFGNAFKRVMGQPPRRYQRENQSAGSH